MTQAHYKPGDKVPLRALRMSAASIDVGDAAAAGGTVPVTIYARSPKAVDHWFFGRIVHDFAGMKAAARISLDYCHNDADIVGFGDKFTIDPERGLVVGSVLTPFHDKDRASEIAHKSKLGVPYEGSIFFDPDELVLEYVPEGFSSPVNGYQFEGPGVIAREWLLRNLAICPNGQDRNTAVEFSAQFAKEVEIRTMPVGKAKKTKLSKKAAPKAKAKPAAAKLSAKGPKAKATKFAEGEEEEEAAAELEESTEETTTTTATEETNELEEGEEATPRQVTCPNCEHDFEVPSDEEGEGEAVEMAEEGEEATTDEEEEEEATGETKLSNKKSGKAFLSAFGKDGAVWFAEGKTFAQAQTLFNKKLLAERAALAKENAGLKSKLGKTRGERKPVSFTSGEEETKGEGKQIAGLSPGLSKFANSIRLPVRRKK